MLQSFQSIYSAKRQSRTFSKKTAVALACLLSLSLTSVSFASEFKEREIKDFRSLDSFDSVSQFDQYIEGYTQECLDNSYGGSLSVRCFVAYELWDRELNKYYKLLRKSLSSEDQAALKAGQLSWLKSRDETIAFNNTVLNQRYAGQRGTMYTALRADEANAAMAPVIRQRALLLKQWHSALTEPLESFEG